MQKEELIDGILKGERRAVSRAISIIEAGRNSELSREILRGIYGRGGTAHIIGITGPPGIGKSTMIGRLSSMLSEQGHNVAVLAVDASSPFTNGSILGNRIRMQEQLTRSGVYMRSLSTGGISGGLSRTVWETVSILEAAGNDTIIVETVGAGQADLDIVQLADTIVVVLAPGLGDEVQAIKAGIMEIGHIFVVNKMDREGAYLAMKDIEETLAMDVRQGWNIPVVGTNSLDGEGYEELIDRISAHGKYLDSLGETERNRIRNTVSMAVRMRMDTIVTEEMEAVTDFLKKKENSEIGDPYSLADSLVKEKLRRLAD